MKLYSHTFQEEFMITYTNETAIIEHFGREN